MYLPEESHICVGVPALLTLERCMSMNASSFTFVTVCERESITQTLDPHLSQICIRTRSVRTRARPRTEVEAVLWRVVVPVA